MVHSSQSATDTLSRSKCKFIKNAAIFSESNFAIRSAIKIAKDRRGQPPFRQSAQVFYIHYPWRSYRAGAYEPFFCRFDILRQP